jgi:Flp pilus assembly protein TadG
MKIFNDQSGQTLVMTACCMLVLLGFTALAVDVGILFRARRNMQIVADAAAVAGAMDYLYNGSVQSAYAAARAAATANGVTDGTGGAVVTPSMPPVDGPNAGIGSFVEVQVSAPNPTYFMRVFNIGSVTVGARAVAGTPSAGNYCMWIMSPTASDTFHVQGSANINTPNCGAYVNSKSPQAFQKTGNGSSFNGTGVSVVGGSNAGGNSKFPVTTGVVPTGPTIGDAITGPNPTTACGSGNTVTASTVTAALLAARPPANGVVCFSAKNVTLSNGVNLQGSAGGTVYLFENGVNIPTGATVNVGSATPPSSQGGNYTNTLGATIDLYGVGSSAGTLSQASNSVLNVYAPTSGPYNAIGIMEPPSNTTTLQVQFGSNNETLDGLIYAPGAEVYMQDQGGGVTASGVVANTMYIKSSTLNIPGYSASNQSTTPFRVVTLVE